MEIQGLQNIQNNLENNKVEGLTFSNFKTYWKVIVNTIVWYWHKDRQNLTQ